MPIIYRDGNQYIWRDGKPRITENLFSVAYSGPRSTGLYGAGVYAYLTVKKLLSESSKNMYALQVAKSYETPFNINFFKPRNLDNVIDFSKALIDCFNAKIGRSGKKYADLLDIASTRGRKMSLHEEVDFSKESINNAIDKTVESFEKHGWDGATQPINVILWDRGYQGVEPGYWSANNNMFGVVIFKEYFERRFVKNYKGGEDVEFGFQVHANDDFVKNCLEDEMMNAFVKYHEEIPRDVPFMFNESIRHSIYFEISRFVREKTGRDHPTTEDYLLYYPDVIENETFVKEIVKKAFDDCTQRNDIKTCKRVKKHESEKIYK